MSLGEYDLNDLLEGDQNFITSIGRDFTMALVVLLAILGRYVYISVIEGGKLMIYSYDNIHFV